MLRNYLKIAYRNLIKQRFYTVINLMGLAVGLACCLELLLYIQSELRYDQHFPEAERIYRLRTDLKYGDNEFRGVTTPAPLGPAIRQDLAGVEAVARIRTWGTRLVRRPDREGRNQREAHSAWVDPAVFDLFRLKVLAGSPAEELARPHTIALSRSMAEKYFPQEEALGKTLLLDDEQTYQVVGVYENLPPETHFHLEFLLSMADFANAKRQVWLSNNFHTYVRLAPEVSPVDFEASLGLLLKKYAEPQIYAYSGGTLKEMYDTGSRFSFYLQPLTEIHFDPTGEYEIEPGGDLRYIYIFAAVAIFILLLACINYVNLATARSARRAREVGVRKAIGGHRGQVITQFLVESTMIVAVAMLLGIWLVDLTLPAFNQLAQKNVSLPWWEPWFWGTMTLVIGLLGALAGLYPAFYLSAHQPVMALTGQPRVGPGRSTLRSALVVFQFAATVVLMIATLVVMQQLSYMRAKNLGFDKEQVLILEGAHMLGAQYEAFRQAMLALPEIKSTSRSSFLPVSESARNSSNFWREGQNIAGESVLMQTWYVDSHYDDVLALSLVYGRFFERDRGTDHQAVVLNQTAVRRLGLSEDPVGQIIQDQRQNDRGDLEDTMRAYIIIGVVKDFHFESLKDQVAPLGLFLSHGGGNLMLRLEGQAIKPVLKQAQSHWEAIAPQQPFSYSFLDERFDQMYHHERRISQIFGTFAGLAMLIACLGLFALSAYLAEQRSKEIAIRKVMGASVSQIMLLLSGHYLKLVALALLFAFPLAWWGMSQWLNDYAYCIQLSPGPFLLASLLALLLALGTVSYQSLRVANQNPADSLRGD